MSRSYVKTIIRQSGNGWTWRVVDRFLFTALGVGKAETRTQARAMANAFIKKQPSVRPMTRLSKGGR